MNHQSLDLGSVGAEPVELWSLRDDVTVTEQAGTDLLLAGRQGSLLVENPAPVVREALNRMVMGPVRLSNVAAHGEDLGTVLLDASHLLVCSLGATDTGGPLLSLVTSAPSVVMTRMPLPVRIRWSRHTVMRFVPGRGLQLESGRSALRVQLHRPEAGAVVGTLGRGLDVDAIARQVTVARPIVIAVVEYLLGAGMLIGGTVAGGFAEDSDADGRPMKIG
ncbi:hypothetical protein ABIB25_002454 [Nakamurella sp. UYEF19]|uniref:hypothetical protein n=1 Tax=Nakamurella sp. UYEF19 TaxID=1756392 RepID=UPI0033930AFD